MRRRGSEVGEESHELLVVFGPDEEARRAPEFREVFGRQVLDEARQERVRKGRTLAERPRNCYIREFKFKVIIAETKGERQLAEQDPAAADKERAKTISRPHRNP